MKKIFAIIIVVLLGWLISTSLISSNIQTELEKYIVNTNKIYASSKVNFKLAKFEKSFFTSKATITIDSEDKMINEIIALPIEVIYDIENGPVFFKNGVKFGAAKMKNRLPINSLLKEKGIFKDDFVLSSECIIKFSKELSCVSTTNETTIVYDDIRVTISPLSAISTTKIDDFTGDFTVNISRILFEDKENSIVLKNTKLSGTTDEVIGGKLILGDYKISSNIVNSGKANPFDIQTDIDMTIKKDSDKTIGIVFDMIANLKQTKLPKDMLDLKSANLKYQLSGLSIDGFLALEKIVKELEGIQEKMMMAQYSSSNIQQFVRFEEQIIEKIVELLNKILVKDRSSISYSLSATTKDSKTTNATIKVGYKGDIITTNVQQMKRKLLDMISLDFDAKLDEAHIKSMPNAPMLEKQLQMVINQGFLKKENSAFVIDVSYKPQTIIINDKDMTSTLLPLLKMFLFAPRGR